MTIENMEKLEDIAKEALKEADLANDFFHTKLAIDTAEHLCRKEKANFEIVKAALLLHHISPRRAKNGQMVSDYRSESLKNGRDILANLGFQEDLIRKVINCTEATYFNKESIADNIEAKVAHDANKLVTIGAIGIARTFAFGGEYKRPIYNSEISIIKSDKDIESYSNMEYDPLTLEPDSISHFKTKILRINERMLTDTGRKMGEKRHKFVLEFLHEFFDEINIKD